MLRRAVLFGQCFCFLYAAQLAFALHDRHWAVVAAVWLGAIGVSTKKLVLYFKGGGR